MRKGDLNKLLKKGDDEIIRIEDKQEELVAQFVFDMYKIEKGDKLIIGGFTSLVVGFETEGKEYGIKIRYKRIRHTGNLDNVVYTTPIKFKIENLGKYNGRY